MMTFSGDGSGGGGSDPLQNLSTVHTRIESVQKFLHNSVNSNTLIGKDQMEIVSAEITSAIHQIIVNGAALLATTQTQNNLEAFQTKIQHQVNNKDKENEDCEIIEIHSVELLAEHTHFCELCGKGFKRDANLRMHMRAHGDRFKTAKALSKPDAEKINELKRGRRFSCPFNGCNRNKQHKKFRPLKSVVCVKNHFKRTHCPKMYSCTRCNNKSFSVMADLKSHLKHCGEVKWKCSCGTSFSRKDKLFGHMALFEGHMPAVMAEEEEAEGVAGMAEMGGNRGQSDGLFDGFGLMDNYCFEDVISSSNANNGLGFWD